MTQNNNAPARGGETTAAARPPGMDLAVRLLKQYETATILGQMEERVALLETLETEIVQDRGVISAANRVMHTCRYEKRRAGVEGKNSEEREEAVALFEQASEAARQEEVAQ